MKVFNLVLNRIFSLEAKNQATSSILNVLKLIYYCAAASIIETVAVIQAGNDDRLDKCVHLLGGKKAFHFCQVSQFQIARRFQLLYLFLEAELIIKAKTKVLGNW
jgi:hypothetical protein